MPVYSNVREEPLKVLMKTGEWTDSTRDNRPIPYKIYYPSVETDEKFPLIIWSHGYGGNANGAGFLSRFLASQGYVLLHITHRGTDSSLWEGKEGHPWDILRKTKADRKTTLNRFKDVPFALDHLDDFNDLPIDSDNIGMSGHSFGAITTQVMAGMTFPDENQDWHNMFDPRFKAGILYSPVPVDHLDAAKLGDLGNPDEAYKTIKIPLLHMTGTNDSAPIGGQTYEHRLSVYENTTDAPKYLLVKESGDHMVYNGTRGKLDNNPDREKHENIIKIMALAFWDAYLKDNQTAKDFLHENGALDFLNNNAIFKYEL